MAKLECHLGYWNGEKSDENLVKSKDALKEIVYYTNKQFYLVLDEDSVAVAKTGNAVLGKQKDDALPIIAHVPAIPIKNLGDPEFCRDHDLDYPYYAGSMAQGISSAEMIEALASAGMLCFFGAGGLSLQEIDVAIKRLQKLGDKRWGINLIHNPNNPKKEADTVDLFIKDDIRLIEASAFFDITLPLVKFRVHGIHEDASVSPRKIITPNRIIAKVSRVEVATMFFSPPPEEMLQRLLQSGDITEEQASLARQIPMAQDITAEADSGGHTDNRPAMALVPSMISLKEQMQAKHNYSQKLRVGAAGGISTPASAAAAFAMGAAYIVTGSVNQACIESGTSDHVRQMLAQTQQADVVMAPAGDMFELGVKVQVLKRGTMFPMRADKLYEIYNRYSGIDSIPAPERAIIEKNFFQESFDDCWNKTKDYFEKVNPSVIVKAEQDPRLKMALLFRRYLNQASRWAISADPKRKMDYQIWCGPAMGAFNEWARSSFLEKPENRNVVTIALNLLHGAAVISRTNALRNQGIVLDGLTPRPQEESKIREYIR